MALPVFVGDRERFVAEQAFMDGPLAPIGLDTEDRVRGFASALWDAAVQGMRPEFDRMRRLQLYYDGLHYANARDNLDLETTNYPFSTVETVFPDLTLDKPRPEIEPGYGTTGQKAHRLQKYAERLMNTAGFDRAYRLSVRELLKLGWSSNLVTFEPRTGQPFPKPWCNWDLYWDPAAHHEDDALYWCLAGPVPTFLLKRMFPHVADKIQPDNWVSPSYDVLVRPWQELAGASWGSTSPRMATPAGADRGFTDTSSSDPLRSGTTFLTAPGGTMRSIGAATTFLIQIIFRDLSVTPVVYRGSRYVNTPYGEVSHPHYMTVPELVCKSGWRVLQITANGVICNLAPLDECFWGLPFTIHRDYEQAFRMWGFGEIDHILSKTKAIDYRSQLVTLALEYAANPVVLADDVNVNVINSPSVEAGSVLSKKRGSEIRWMEPPQIGPEFFAYLQAQKADIQDISGVQDAQAGARPPGIQTGIAVQSLQEAAGKRVRGKEGGLSDSFCLLLKKLLVSTAMKLNRRIQFRSTDGLDMTIDPEDILGEYEIRFEKGSGFGMNKDTRRMVAERLFQLGAVDAQEVLEAYDWPNRQAVAMRMQQQQMMAELAKAKMASESGPPGGK